MWLKLIHRRITDVGEQVNRGGHGWTLVYSAVELYTVAGGHHDRLVDASVADELAEQSGRVLGLQRVALAHRDGRGALGEPHEDEIVDRLHDLARAQESAWKVAPGTTARKSVAIRTVRPPTAAQLARWAVIPRMRRLKAMRPKCSQTPRTSSTIGSR